MAKFIEQDCTVDHEGRCFTAGGAYVAEDRALGYVGELLNDGGLLPRALTDWHGNQIGRCGFTSSWRINSYIGSRMYQVLAIIDGVKFTGRGFGEGLSVNLRRRAKQ